MTEKQKSQIVERLLEAAREGRLLDEAYGLTVSDGIAPETVGEATAKLSSEHSVDVVAEFKNLDNSENSTSFFLLRNIFMEVLPHLRTSIREIMECVIHLTRQAKDDGTANWLVKPFIEYLSPNKDLCREAMGLLENDKSLVDLLEPVLVAGARLELVHFHGKALELAKSCDPEIRNRAIFSLGKIDYVENELLLKKSVRELSSAAEEATDDLLLANLIKSAFLLYRQHQSLKDEVVAILLMAVTKGGTYSIHAVSSIFAFECEHIPEDLIAPVLDCLSSVDPERKGTLQYIDMGIKSCLARDSAALGMELLERLLKAHDGSIQMKDLKFTKGMLRSAPGELLNKLCTRWLLTGEYKLCRAVSAVIEHEHRKGPEVEVDVLELPDQKDRRLIFLARKAIGFIFLRPDSAAAYVLSIYELADSPEARSHLEELLFDPLMLNFPGTLGEFLESRSKNSSDPETQACCKKLLSRFKDYVSGLSYAKGVAEHLPPLSHKEIERQRFASEMTHYMKEAEKQSVLLPFIKKSVILYGRKWAMYGGSPGAQKSRMESALKTVETSVDMPRLQGIDPLGLNYTLFQFKSEQFA